MTIQRQYHKPINHHFSTRPRAVQWGVSVDRARLDHFENNTFFVFSSDLTNVVAFHYCGCSSFLASIRNLRKVKLFSMKQLIDG